MNKMKNMLEIMVVVLNMLFIVSEARFFSINKNAQDKIEN